MLFSYRSLSLSLSLSPSCPLSRAFMENEIQDAVRARSYIARHAMHTVYVIFGNERVWLTAETARRQTRLLLLAYRKWRPSRAHVSQICDTQILELRLRIHASSFISRVPLCVLYVVCDRSSSVCRPTTS